MEWNLLLQEIVYPALGAALTALLTWLTTVIINWINSKVKDKKLADLLKTITEVVTMAVKSTYQTYVESLKGTNAWTKEAQAEALQRALDKAKRALSTDALKYIEEQHGDIDAYIRELIESLLYDLKQKK